MILDDATTINGWTRSPPGSIHLRAHRVRKSAPDLDAAHGILNGAAIGAAVLAWLWAAAVWLTRWLG